MRSRSLYCFILRLHPSAFRQKYEDQMLWIFDESVGSRGAVSLLFDALVSLARQWVLRSGYWRHFQPTMAIDGANALTEQLRRNAETLHQKAWRLNLLWMTGAFIVLPLSRMQMFSNWLMIVIAIRAIGTYWRGRQGRRAGAKAGELVAPFLFGAPEVSRRLYQRWIDGKRDGLIEWCRFQPSKIPWNAKWYFGGKFLLVLLVVAGVGMLLRPLRPGTTYDWLAFLEFISGLMVLTVFWRFTKKVNERAAEAIQQELDALDEPSKPQSV